MNNRSGQALLMVLLSVGVVITIALSVVSRSGNDISVTTHDEESLRAFSAAEAGVEDVLKRGTAAIPVTGTESKVVSTTQTYNANFATFPENPRSYLYPAELASGDVATIWFATHAADNSLQCGASDVCYTGNTIQVCWGKLVGDTASQPAFVAAILYNDTATSTLKYSYATYDPNASRASTNRFQSGGIVTDAVNGACTAGSGNTRMANQVTIPLTTLVPPSAISGRQLKALSLTTLYNASPTIIGVNTSADLPVQGRRIDSSGVSGGSTRKVQVYSLYPEVPNMFQAAIFSPPGIVK